MCVIVNAESDGGFQQLSAEFLIKNTVYIAVFIDFYGKIFIYERYKTSDVQKGRKIAETR